MSRSTIKTVLGVYEFYMHETVCIHAHSLISAKKTYIKI